MRPQPSFLFTSMKRRSCSIALAIVVWTAFCPSLVAEQNTNPCVAVWDDFKLPLVLAPTIKPEKLKFESDKKIGKIEDNDEAILEVFSGEPREAQISATVTYQVEPGTKQRFDKKHCANADQQPYIGQVDKTKIKWAVSGVVAEPQEGTGDTATFKLTEPGEGALTFTLKIKGTSPDWESAEIFKWVPLVPFGIAADVDRNGVVDFKDDQTEEEKWAKERGAIYTVNYDRDGDNVNGSESRPDAIYFDDAGKGVDEEFQIETANSNSDQADIAPLHVMAMTMLPKSCKVFLKAEEKEDFHAMHLFAKIQGGQETIWGSYGPTAGAPWASDEGGGGRMGDPGDLEVELTKWTNPKAADYDPSTVFGIEGLVLKGMKVDSGSLSGATGMFSGELLFTLEIRRDDGTVVGSEAIRLRVAPWLALSHQEPSLEFWSSYMPGDPASVRFLYETPAANPRHAGMNHASGNQLRRVQDEEEIWFQDHCDIGFTQRPGGPPMHLLFRLPYVYRANPQPIWPVHYLLAPDFGVFQIGQNIDLTNGREEGNYGGNFEMIPPNSVNPMGALILGDTASRGLEQFLIAQEFQVSAPASFAEIPCDWLAVGHIDEICSFGPGNRVLVADSRGALELLESAIPKNDRGKRVFFATSGNTWGGVTTQETPSVDNPATPENEALCIYTGRNHVALGDTYRYLRFYAGAARGQVVRVMLRDGYVIMQELWDKGQSATPSNPPAQNTWRTRPVAGSKFVMVEDSLLENPISVSGVIREAPSFITVEEILADPEFVSLNRTAVPAKLNLAESRIRNLAPNAHFVTFPALFEGMQNGAEVVDQSCVAFNPGPPNLQPLNGNLYTNRQFGPVNHLGEDIFEKAIRDSVAETIYFVDDWASYHVLFGELHCGTAVKRQIPSWNWWSKLTP